MDNHDTLKIVFLLRLVDRPENVHGPAIKLVTTHGVSNPDLSDSRLAICELTISRHISSFLD